MTEQKSHNSWDPLDLINPSDLQNALKNILWSIGYKEGEELSIHEKRAEDGDLDEQILLAHQAEAEYGGNQRSSAKALQSLSAGGEANEVVYS